jgi:hypothetical protein
MTKSAFPILGLILLPLFAIGQGTSTSFRTTNNYTSIRYGLGYPFFSEGNYSSDFSETSQSYKFFNKGLNYSIHGGIGLGHFFGKKFSISVSPLLIYSKFVKTDYHFEYRTTKQQALIGERNGYFFYSNLSVLFPIEFRFPLNENINLSGGVFMFKPIFDREFDDYSGIDYLRRNFNGNYVSNHPPVEYTPFRKVNKNFSSYYRSGVHIQLSFRLKEKDWQQNRVNIEYYHSLETGNMGAFEKWILVSFRKIFFQ